MTDGQNLLAEYVRAGSETAFRELVTRYVNLVYSTALRLVGGDSHRAEDVAQTVFLNLARAARTLPKDVKLGGWLHRDTCFVASTLMRGERRRQSRERQAAEMNALQTNSGADFSLVAPLLDEAINELGEADRTAILLRFFEQHDFRSVGEALGSNEDAARMRVTRALEKLEEFLKRRGVTTTTASLGVVLSVNAVQAAPVGLAITISTAAALAGTSIASTATATAAKAIAMTTLQKAIIGATLAAAIGTGIYQVNRTAQPGEVHPALPQPQAMLEEQPQTPSQEPNQQPPSGREAQTGRAPSPSASTPPRSPVAPAGASAPATPRGTPPDPGAFLASAGNTLVAGQTAGSQIFGKVTLQGTPPAALEITMDETCGKLHTEKVTTRHYVVGKDAGLANVLVYVKSGLTGAQKAPDVVPVVDQKNCMYEPYITGLMVGQKLKIKNSDTGVPLHNVHASQNPLTGAGKDFFNDPQPAGFADLEKTFSAPEVMVKFKCDVHPWMFAYIGVVENPYFAVTDKDGNFTIKGLPAGKYTVVAFHEKTHRGAAGVSQEVTVAGDAKAGENVQLDFEIQAPVTNQ